MEFSIQRKEDDHRLCTQNILIRYTIGLHLEHKIVRLILLLALTIAMFGSSCNLRTDGASRKKGKTLHINISREPPTLDPRKVFDPSHMAVSAMLFEGLTKLQSDLTVTLAQADSIEISPDQLIYTIHLGPHLWSNGERVTALDFEQTFLSILDPVFPSPHSHLLYDVRGAEEAKKGLQPLSQVSIRSIDEKTLQIGLARPNPSFLQILASSALMPTYRETKSANWGESIGPDFVCNGPFLPVSWNHHVELIVQKNPIYQGSILPKLDRIHISMIDNETTALHLYATGQLDIIGTPFSQIPLPYLKELKEQNSLSIRPVAASLFCGFNTTAYPFQNQNLRKAFSSAINRSALIEHITLLDEEPGYSAIPPVLKPNRWSEPSEDGNRELARRYLEAGLAELQITPKDLESLTLHYWPFEINVRIAQALQHQWLQTLGIKIKIQVIDFKTLLTKVQANDYEFALFAWSADYGDPLSLLDRFRVASDGKNYTHWESSAFNRLLNASSYESDPDKRLEILEAAEAILMEEAPLAPLFHWNFSLLVQPYVKGFTMDPLGTVHFEQITISK